LKTFAIILVVSLSFLAPGLTQAKDKPLRNSVVKKVKIEGLSHKGGHRFGYVSQPTRRGKKAQRFEIRHGDCGRSSGWNDCENDRGRVEMKESPKNSMSKPGQGVWYGYSILIPKDFVSLGRANTMLGQVKAEGWSMPMWSLTFNDSPYLNFADNKKCKIGSMSSWQGRWIDVTIYAHYGTSGQSVYFQLFKDGKLICQRKAPFLPAEFARKKPKLGLKYGIYNSFVNRYLAKHGRMPSDAKAYNQSHEGGTSKSPSPVPYEFDWGVSVPTHVIYYDEMRYGSSREDVDVRMLEARGVPPVD
jgi:polysaccharide lyase-like protein